MPNGALLDPSNRLLGGATGDFSLYGALPAVTIGATPPTSDPTLLTVPLRETAEPTARATDADTAFSPHGDAVPFAVADIPAASPVPAVQPPPPAPSTAAAPGPAPAPVAAPTGSGTIAPIVPDTTLPIVSRTDAADSSATLTHGLSASSLAAPVLAAVQEPSVAALGGLAPAIITLATPALDGAGATAGTVLATVGAVATDTGLLLDGIAHDAALPAIDATVTSVAAALPDVATDVLGAVGDAATTTVHGLTDTATDTLATVDTTVAAALPDTAADIVGTAGAAATTTIASIADTAGDTVAPVATALPDATTSIADSAGAAAATTVGAVSDTTDDTLAGIGSSAVDTLASVDPSVGTTAPTMADDQFGGTDPAAGVTTLVSMVETAAVFEVSQPSEEPQPDAGGSIIDSLAADEAPAALLGDAAHDSTATEDGVLSHDHHGIPGLP